MLPPRKQNVNNPTVLVMTLVTRKNLNSILLTPAIMQRMSSGKKGKSIIKKNAVLPLAISRSTSSALLSPTAHGRIFFPKNLPNKYATILPDRMARRLMKNAFHGPNKMIPARVVTLDGNGTSVTCKNCNRAKSVYDNIPALCMMLLSSDRLLNLPIIPLFCRIKYTANSTPAVMKKIIPKRIVALCFKPCSLTNNINTLIAHKTCHLLLLAIN